MFCLLQILNKNQHYDKKLLNENIKDNYGPNTCNYMQLKSIGEVA